MEGLSGSRFSCLCSLLIQTIHNYYTHCFRWLQIAKKMLAKSKKEGAPGFEGSTKGSNTNGRRPLPQPASGQSLATVRQTFHPSFPSTSSPTGWSCRRSSPSDLPAHIQRKRERPHPCLQLQPDQAFAWGQGQIQP